MYVLYIIWFTLRLAQFRLAASGCSRWTSTDGRICVRFSLSSCCTSGRVASTCGRQYLPMVSVSGFTKDCRPHDLETNS